MHRTAALTLILLGALASGCSVASGRVPGSPSGAGSAAASASNCHVRGALPDPVCTPGSRDPAVSQANIRRTICVAGYTRRVRPPVSYTEPLKLAQIRAYHYYAGRSARSYEEDHLVPLELGGAPRDPRNLWPEAHRGSGGSFTKDAAENLLRRRVCDGKESLAQAQHDIATDWVAVYEKARRSR